MRCGAVRVWWDCQCRWIIKFSGNEIRCIIISCWAGQGRENSPAGGGGGNVDHRKANIKEDIKGGEYDVNEMGNDEHLPLYVAISNHWNDPLGDTSPSITAPLSYCCIPSLMVCSGRRTRCTFLLLSFKDEGDWIAWRSRRRIVFAEQQSSCSNFYIVFRIKLFAIKGSE